MYQSSPQPKIFHQISFATKFQQCRDVKFFLFFLFVHINLILYDLLNKKVFIMSSKGVLMD